MTNFNIKIISDNVCPWCYVGKSRLDKAIALYQKTVPAGKDDTFTVTWSPFYLDPTSPKQGVPLRERMAQRFGPGRFDAIKDMLVQAAVKGGLEAGEAYALGVSGVPHFVVDGQQLGGAQDVEAFVEVFANIKEKRA
ncbi:hypothetical protein VdG1_05736 [Verticillium dahliae VDG1]|nr:hypothetical protein VdG1_05736 [Verticillium dahliae VDG1]